LIAPGVQNQLAEVVIVKLGAKVMPWIINQRLNCFDFELAACPRASIDLVVRVITAAHVVRVVGAWVVPPQPPLEIIVPVQVGAHAGPATLN
jgi:hypothetical protein